MVGLVEMLGGLTKDPKAKTFFGNALSDLGYGLTNAPDFGSALGTATRRTADMSGVRLAEEEKRKADQLAANQSNMTRELFAKQAPDLVPLMDAGMPVNELFGEYMRRMQPQGQGMEPTANMRDFMFAQENPAYGEFLRGSASGNLPASAQEYEYAKGQGFTGSMEDWMRAKSAAGRSPMDSGTRKEIFEADDAATAGNYVLSALDEAIKLNDAAFEGPLADVRGDAMALMGDQNGVATSRLKNLTTEMALSQLKTVFGAMPTEGERKILLELQGSVNQPRAVRAEIYRRAKKMAERRQADNRAKAEALRAGDYFTPGYAPGSQSDSGGIDDLLTKYGM